MRWNFSCYYISIALRVPDFILVTYIPFQPILIFQHPLSFCFLPFSLSHLIQVVLYLVGKS